MPSSINIDLPFFVFTLCSASLMVVLHVAVNQQRFQSPPLSPAPIGISEKRANELQLRMNNLMASIEDLTSILNRYYEDLTASQHMHFPGFDKDFSNERTGRHSSLDSHRVHTISSGDSTRCHGSHIAHTADPDVECNGVEPEDVESEDIKVEDSEPEDIEVEDVQLERIQPDVIA